MATAAFKSNSKRSSNDKASSPKSNPNNKPENPKQKQRLRRSLSVSAVSRTTCEEEFLNKRDNPLYWGSPDNKKNNNNTSEESKVVVVLQNVAQRGRSVVRNSGGQMEIGRRGRSVSRPRFPQEVSRHEMPRMHWIMFGLNTSAALVSTKVTDASKLVKPSSVGLVLGIRREYAKELEESQERARKLRSDLAIEEHHKQELSRILKENLPEPKTSSSHRSRGRKSSSERKKMSKRLTDEAMSYFDECVSISAFDSSDFSAAEDPSVNSLNTTPIRGATSSGLNRCIDQQVIFHPSRYNYSSIYASEFRLWEVLGPNMTMGSAWLQYE
ncbi:hypothetical protein Tco_1406784 [Tanacetum coccineum]